MHPEVKNWIKYARFEDKHGYIAHGRKVFERAVEFFGEEHVDENLFVAFARFEEMQKEVRYCCHDVPELPLADIQKL